LAHNNNGRYAVNPSSDFEKLKEETLKPYQKAQAARHVFDAIKAIVVETDMQDDASVEKSLETIKNCLQKLSKMRTKGRQGKQEAKKRLYPKNL
jgi:hypothetical protein